MVDYRNAQLDLAFAALADRRGAPSSIAWRVSRSWP
jgi:hypothetical protein